MPPHEFEKAVFFEGCLPIEELARRGVDTLRYGPMKPVGLTAPDGRRPWAVVQLRQENLAKSHFNLVGFQSRMKWRGAAAGAADDPRPRERPLRALRADPPQHLHQRADPPGPLYRVKSEPRVRLAGQITGVEGYLESAATGLAIGLYLSLERARTDSRSRSRPTTALGALARHLTESDPKHFQPANINYGLFEELPGRVRKADRREPPTPSGRTPTSRLDGAARAGARRGREAAAPAFVGAT